MNELEDSVKTISDAAEASWAKYVTSRPRTDLESLALEMLKEPYLMGFEAAAQTATLGFIGETSGATARARLAEATSWFKGGTE